LMLTVFPSPPPTPHHATCQRNVIEVLNQGKFSGVRKIADAHELHELDLATGT
jgi:hypothetical protein